MTVKSNHGEIMHSVNFAGDNYEVCPLALKKQQLYMYSLSKTRVASFSWLECVSFILFPVLCLFCVTGVYPNKNISPTESVKLYHLLHNF